VTDTLRMRFTWYEITYPNEYYLLVS